MPYATRRLACYEKLYESGGSKAFHFFTTEARRSQTVVTDFTALYKSLNKASQALHNMFEFFNEAGPQHTAKFFSEVRFFSAVASTEGLLVRIHRAVQVAKDRMIIPGYPLHFEFREYAKIPRETFDREPVVQLFSKILINYGVDKLFGLPQDAAKTIAAKLRNKPGEQRLRDNPNFYRHGQGGNTPNNSRRLASSRIPTLTTSRGRSDQTRISVETEQGGVLPGSAKIATPMLNQSCEILQGRTTTPTQSQAPQSTQVSNSSAKRCRTQSEDGNPPQRTKRLKPDRDSSQK